MSLRLSVYKTSWPLEFPVRITGRVFHESEALTVEVSDGENTGRGEALGVYYLNDNYPNMHEQIEAVRSHIESGISIEEVQDLLPPCGARNALDCALWDLETKRSGKSIWELTGVDPAPTKTLFTIGIEDTPEGMAQKAKGAREFPVLKVKLDNIEPVERMTAIRAARPDAVLVVDANQGFDIDLLNAILPDFEHLDIKMIEQPLPRGMDSELADYSSPIALCADESCLSLSELQATLAIYDMVNIKLDKAGGLTEGLEIARQTRAAGKRVMVGNMAGTSLSMCPAYVVAQFCDFIDLDGPLSLKSDYLDGMKYSESLMMPPRGFWGRIQH